jgi:hypothetical protein
MPRKSHRIFTFKFVPVGFFARVAACVMDFSCPLSTYSSGIFAKSRAGTEYLLVERSPSGPSSVSASNPPQCPPSPSQPSRVLHQQPSTFVRSGSLASSGVSSSSGGMSITLQVFGDDLCSLAKFMFLVIEGIRSIISGWYSEGCLPEETVLCHCSAHPIPVSVLEERLIDKKQDFDCPILCQPIPITELAPDLTLEAHHCSLSIEKSQLTLVRPIGSGSFGTVWLGKWAKFLISLPLPPSLSLSLFPDPLTAKRNFYGSACCCKICKDTNWGQGD